MTKLAIDGGLPVRTTMLPYARQSIDDDDRAVVNYTGAAEAVAVNTGTVLHAVWAAGIAY